MMTAVNYVMVYCTQCGERRKLAPEKAYEPSAFEWPQLRARQCPICKGPMKRMPEYGEPTCLPQGYLPMSGDVEWMA
jgi:formate dehydrogenase maturation protein FdhE